MRRRDEQGAAVRATQRAREAASVNRDRLQHRTPFAHAHAPLVGDIGVPDGGVGIDADAIGIGVTEVGPDVRRFPRLPSAAMSKAVSRWP